MAPPRIGRLAFCGLASVSLFVSRLAYAQGDEAMLSPTFGSPGQVVVWGGSSIQAPFSPQIDYFIARNLSLGLDVDVSLYDYSWHGADASEVETRSTTFSAGPRLGANFPLGDMVSWFPRLTIGYESVHWEERLASGQSLSIPGPFGYRSTTRSGPYIFVDAPVLLHPVRHFFVGFGPEFFRDLGNVSGGPNIGGQRTSFGASLVLGGYWGGVGPVAPEDPPKDLRPSRRFGDAHELVLTNAIGASIRAMTYAGTRSSWFGTSIRASADYFVVDRVSLGFEGGASHSSSTGVAAMSGLSVTDSDTNAGIWARVGYNLPLGTPLSFYPRAYIGLAVDIYDETSGSSEYKSSPTSLGVGLLLPLLVHPAPHFFAGVGPDLRLIYGRTTTSWAVLIGGWI